MSNKIPNVDDLTSGISNLVNSNDMNVQTQWYLFMIVTVMYFVIRWIRSGKEYSPSETQDEIKKWDNLWLLFYVCFSIVVQVLTNFQLTQNRCGSTYYNLAINSVVFPWLFIFGPLIAILDIIPGWKAPFSNTIGYLITKMNGIETILKGILKTPNGQDKTATAQAIKQIYSDPSILINEITPENFDTFWQQSEKDGLFKSNLKDINKSKNFLRSRIVRKDLISEFIWYVLTGTFVLSLTYSYIISEKCNLTPDQLKQQENNYNKVTDAIQKLKVEANSDVSSIKK